MLVSVTDLLRNYSKADSPSAACVDFATIAADPVAVVFTITSVVPTPLANSFF